MQGRSWLGGGSAPQRLPKEEFNTGIRVKSIFCFTIAREMKRKGIATQLLERVCKDAAQDGFDFVEAYPKKDAMDDAENFRGPFEMYKRSGFTVYDEAEQELVYEETVEIMPHLVRRQA